jgi:hypothetical protein
MGSPLEALGPGQRGMGSPLEASGPGQREMGSPLETFGLFASSCPFSGQTGSLLVRVLMSDCH